MSDNEMIEEGDKILMTRPTTRFQAWNYISLGAFFFLFTGGKGTAIVSWGGILGILGFTLKFVLAPAIDNYITDRVNIETRKPLQGPAEQPTSFDFSFSNKAFAAPVSDGEIIRINGVAWGYNDPRYETWKLEGEPTVMIYDKNKPKQDPVFLTIPGLENKVQQKQSK